ncbi:exported hypothetical protein [Cupriavidus taiwanensis]|uniref:Uncharacterized protein n=1 Tax=Cupriavidus taiwanensis TaxID=164546 RepID=A0A375BFU0_9BURK|nr:exported hypothetical protein [Cupriavidus taiwanensis]
MFRETNHPTMPGTTNHLASRVVAALLAAAALCVGGNAARAADLRIGYKAEISAADPHVLDAAGRNLWGHVYETLVGLDNALRPVPQLATAGASWTTAPGNSSCVPACASAMASRLPPRTRATRSSAP